MKILVFSDSHGNCKHMQKALEMHPDAQMLLHAGDGKQDLEHLESPPGAIYAANGNFEDAFGYFQKTPRHIIIEAEGKRLLLCHGHKHHVSFGTDNLIYAALEEKADIAVFGHTHVKHSSYVPSDCSSQECNGIYLFNPGSISRPRDGLYPSFGIIDIQEGGILLSHGLIKN